MAIIRMLQFRWSDEERWRDLYEIPHNKSADEAIAAARQAHEQATRRFAHSFTPVFRIEERD